MASVRERKRRTGTVYAVLFRHQGVQSSLTYPTKRGAEKMRDLMNAIGPDAALATLDDEDGDWTVPAWVRHHIDHLTGVEEGTKSDYRGYVTRSIDPHLNIPLTALTREAVERWVNTLATAGLSGKSIRNRHSLLSAAATRAVRSGLLPDNPCKGIRLPRSKRTAEKCFLSYNEYVLLLSRFPDRWQPLVVTLFGTGMRINEALALQVGDVDLDAPRPVIHVRRAWKHTDGNGHAIGLPKSSAGERTVRIGRVVVDALRPLTEGRPADAWLFTTTRGGPVRYTYFNDDVWANAVKLANGELPSPKWRGLAPLEDNQKLGRWPTPHDARHTHASWQIARGVPLTHIQSRLGHESITTTSDTYGHLLPDAHDEMAAVADLAMSGGNPQIEG